MESEYLIRTRAFLNQIEARMAVKTGLVATLSWALGMGFSKITDRPDSLVSGLWCTVTAIVVLQTYLGGTYKAALMRLFGVVLGSLIGAFCTPLLGSNPFSLGFSIFLTVIVCSLFANKDSIRIACLSVAVVMVLWGLHPEISPWKFAFFRTIDSLLGVLVAVAVAHAIWPFQATEKLRLNMSQLISYLNQLYRLIMDITLTDKEVNAESIQLLAQMQPLFQQDLQYLTEAKLELLTKPEKLEEWVLLNENLENLFEVILALKQVSRIPRKIFDEALEKQTSKIISMLDHALQDLSHGLTMAKTVTLLFDLSSAQKELHDDLTRFRNTRATRQFALSEVESFYVFFFSLNSMIDEVEKLTKNVNALSDKD